MIEIKRIFFVLLALSKKKQHKQNSTEKLWESKTNLTLEITIICQCEETEQLFLSSYDSLSYLHPFSAGINQGVLLPFSFSLPPPSNASQSEQIIEPNPCLYNKNPLLNLNSEHIFFETETSSEFYLKKDAFFNVFSASLCHNIFHKLS